MQVTVFWRELLWLLLAFFAIALVHELGHVVAGWAVGARGASISYGNPSSRWQTVLPLGPLRIQWNWGLGLWLSAPRYGFEHWPSRTTFRHLLMVLGGPAASTLLLLLVWPDSTADLVWWLKPGLTAQQVIQFQALWSALAPLVPLRYLSGLRSDGLQIVSLASQLLRPQRNLTT